MSQSELINFTCFTLFKFTQKVQNKNILITCKTTNPELKSIIIIKQKFICIILYLLNNIHKDIILVHTITTVEP